MKNKPVKKPIVKPVKTPVAPYTGKGTRARLNTAAEKMMFNTKASK